MTSRQVVSLDGSRTAIFFQLMVGAVFLSERVQRFLFPVRLGAGRFEKIGLPNSGFPGRCVGSVGIICGTLVLIGLLGRLTSIPLIIIMLFAIATKKAEVLAHDGFWEMMHGTRTDWALLLGSVFLLIKGVGRCSDDQILVK